MPAGVDICELKPWEYYPDPDPDPYTGKGATQPVQVNREFTNTVVEDADAYPVW